MYVARSVQIDGRQIGLVRTSHALDAIDQRIFELLQRVVLSALIALAVALLLGWLVGRRITDPLRKVSAAVASLERGEYSRRIHVDSEDEIGALASTINHLGESLGRRVDEIRRDRNETLSILASMTEGVIAVDQDERIVHLNDAAAAMLRIDADACIGMHFWEAVRVSEICSLVTRVVRDQETADLEIKTSVALGGRELEMHGNRMHSPDGGTAGAVLVVRDVTELRRLEKIRTEFVSNVSHELKTPLTVISGLVESILNDPEMEEATRQRFMMRVHAQAQRLSDLVRDLLSLSRAERLVPRKDLQIIDLRASLRESIGGIEPLTEEKGLTLKVDLPSTALPVRADMESLRQIFDNLLSNACRYTAKGGSIEVTAREADGQISVAIADTGIGIDERQQARVFERFYRVDSARSRELGGTGLGLAIVKHVAHGLGGDVQLKSEPGVGSVFTVRIPTASEVAGTE
jgi:two-component system phosphate regulon sensor histidine kinase PhoR